MGKIIQTFKIDDAFLSEAIHARQCNIAQNGKIQNQAFALAVFCNKANAGFNSVLGLFNMQGLAMKGNLAALAAVHAENSSHNFCAPGAHKARYA